MAGPLECLRTHTPDVQSIIVPEKSWHSFCGHLLGGCGKVYELGDGSRGKGARFQAPMCGPNSGRMLSKRGREGMKQALT